MRHYGDITKLSGYELPIVDVITGGSPCQDLSVAGKRAGLDGERSGLFMEQVRIVKEMREHSGRTDKLIRPRFMVWENVPGAFSSNGGKDFQAVLTEIIRIADPDAPDVPLPATGKWSKSGCIYGEMGDWSVAWRLHDAQFWGVPQRRKRIALVADFGGLSAPEILFERKGMSWNCNQVSFERENPSGCVKDNTDDTISFQERAGKPGGGKGILIQYNRVGALSTLNNQAVLVSDTNAMRVRRLTPLEYERLQGFPDGWTDLGSWVDCNGSTHNVTDSQRYKALGNSIATPFWFYLLRRISAQYERPATLGSLFDGIGGFPYCWERCNGKGTAVWASEIEEFPIAVTKARFGDE